MTNKKRNLHRLLIGLFLLALLAACTSSEQEGGEDQTQPAEEAENSSSDTEVNSESSRSDGDATIITFAVDGWQRGLYEQQVELFEEDNPDIKIEFVTIDEIFGSQDEYYQDPESGLLQIAQQADVVSTFFSPGSLDQLFLDLGPFMDQDSGIDIDDFYVGALDVYTQGGQLLAVPTTVSFQLIFFDKDMFDAAGVAYPEIGWSWDDFLATAQEMTVKSGSEITQYGFSPLYGGAETMVSAKVGPIFNPNAEPPTSNLDDPDIIDGYEWYLSLFNDYGVMPNPRQPTSQEEFESGEFVDPYQLIEDGKVAMYIEQSDSYFWRTQEGGKNLGVVPFPVSAGNDRTTPINGFAGSPLAISKGTAKADAAWKWVSFLLNQGPDDSRSFGPQNTLPSRKSVAAASGVLDDLDEEFVDAVQYAAEHSFALVYPQVGGEKYYQEISKLTNEEEPDVVAILTEAKRIYDEAVLEESGGEATPIPEFTVAEPPSSQISEDDTVVRFVVAGGDPSAFRELAKQYSEDTPNILIKIEEPNYYNEEFSVGNLIGDADCFQWWGPISGAEEMQSILSVQPFLDADNELSEDDFFPAALEQYRDEGQVMGLPSTIQIQLLNYNKRLFDAAGLEYPQPGWTLDQFLDVAVAITTDAPDDEKVYGYVPDLFETGNLFTFINLQGAEMFDRSVDPPQAAFNSPEFIDAVRWYANLSTEYGVKPEFEIDPRSFTGAEFEERQGLIDSDRAGIWPYEDGSFVVFGPGGEDEAPDRSHIGVVPYPQGANGAAAINFSNGYYISADTQARQPCWEWIKHLTNQESISQFGVPARIAVAESAEFAQRVGAENAQVMVDTLNSTTSGVESPFALFDNWMGSSFQFLEKAFNDILSEESTVEEAMQVAQDKADTYRQCVIENDLLESDNFEEMQECIKEADPDYEGF